MDRTYKAADRVVVFETTRKPQSIQTPVDTFSDRPYVHAGFDVYLYKGVVYGAYVCADAECRNPDCPQHGQWDDKTKQG